MRHYTRIRTTCKGVPVITLVNDDGETVEALDRFAEQMVDHGAAHRTIDRYCDVVANFIDYLTEVGVFGTSATLREINQAIESYIPIRLRAADLRSKARSGSGDEFEHWAGKIAESLNMRPLSPNSLANTLAAINDFLRLAERTHQLKIEAAQFHGTGIENGTPQRMFEALSRVAEMTSRQKHSMMQHSVLASVMRLHPDGIKRPTGLSSKLATKKHASGDRKEFPMEYLPPLFDAATSWRDRTLWLLIAAAGLRTHEAAQIRWSNVDVERRRVYVEDPDGLRFSEQLSKKERLRFKGRQLSETYLIPPFNDMFFAALEAYTRLEFTPGVGHDFVFQDIRRGKNGRPYYEISDEAQIQAFRRACEKAGVPRKSDGRPYGKHSLRHFYGVFTLNYLPVPGGYGLKLSEVQKLMGHASITTTAHYARLDAIILETKLMFADRAILSSGEHLDSLPRLIADRLESEAQKIRKEHDQR